MQRKQEFLQATYIKGIMSNKSKDNRSQKKVKFEGQSDYESSNSSLGEVEEVSSLQDEDDELS